MALVFDSIKEGELLYTVKTITIEHLSIHIPVGTVGRVLSKTTLGFMVALDFGEEHGKVRVGFTWLARKD